MPDIEQKTEAVSEQDAAEAASQEETKAPKPTRFVANPVEVTAFQIVDVGANTTAGTLLALDNGQNVVATFQMTSRYQPVAGDYWVVQEDGYTYLNPKSVFERKYSPVTS